MSVFPVVKKANGGAGASILWPALGSSLVLV